MKKTWIVICLILSFLIIYLLQSNFFSWFNISGVKPNLFVVLVLVTGLFIGRRAGILFGVLFGISLDFFISKSIGISAVMLGIIGFIGGYLDKSFSKDSRITMITIIAITTFLYEIGIITFNYFINGAQLPVLYVIKTLIIELIYNSIITIIIYPLIMKLGYRIEENFKDFDVFEGIKAGLEEALAYERGTASPETFARKNSEE